jgi:hypothetical protein
MNNDRKREIDGLVEDIKYDIKDTKEVNFDEIEYYGDYCTRWYGKEGYELFLEKLFNL